MTPRPWRLTRRQRVEMEAALSDLRRLRRPRQQIATVVRAAWIAGAIYYAWPDDLGSDPRTLRARVAIALRAALRADEDARCEEAFARSRHGIETDAMREWPDLDRGWYGRVPLALWARKPSLRAQSPPTSGRPKHGW